MYRTLIVLMLCIITIPCMAQKKCKFSKKSLRQANKHLDRESITHATPMTYLFSKFSQAASANFVKSAEGYFLRVQLVRDMHGRIDIMEDNPIVFQLANDSLITLYPDAAIVGKFSFPLTMESNRPFYKVTEEQLNMFAKNRVLHLKVYYVSDRIAEKNIVSDDLGTFLDYEILNKKYQSNLMEPAVCIQRDQ